ncbi:unnamed protein product [Caenorhabditis angaria]|uniref:Serpentine receptor class gamma n=1 Tax=Caenorhabditis angaria TaxID=860376 RepID=A0A9P1IHC9_9PELO|nr:unnamed protein product [Caenorhabditis angaria]
MDSIGSIFLLLSDIFFGRIAIFFPQLCPIFLNFFGNCPFSAHFAYPFYNYLRALKPVIQAFMCINRMSCVIWPVDYSFMWSQNMRKIILSILLLPFLVIWNTMISEKSFVPIRGGLAMNYKRRVSWASLSLFQLIFITISLLITIICTSITLFKMSTLKTRLKSSEKTLCIVSIIISCVFLTQAALQSYFAFFHQNAENANEIILFAMFLVYDLQNFVSPIILLAVSQELRKNLFGKRAKSENLGMSTISKTISNSSQKTATTNLEFHSIN